MNVMIFEKDTLCGSLLQIPTDHAPKARYYDLFVCLRALGDDGCKVPIPSYKDDARSFRCTPHTICDRCVGALLYPTTMLDPCLRGRLPLEGGSVDSDACLLQTSVKLTPFVPFETESRPRSRRIVTVDLAFWTPKSLCQTQFWLRKA